MDDKTRTVRRRVRAGQPSDPTPESPAVEGTAPKATPPAAPETPAPAKRPKFDMSGLEAIASMGADEMASLLDGVTPGKPVEPGDQLTGQVARVTAETVFIDVGRKAEGLLVRDELPDVKAGDEVTAFVVAVHASEIQLSTKLSGAAAASFIETALSAEIPVEGRVIRRSSGGYDVKIGSAHAFCPISQIERLPGVDPDHWLNQTLEFRVIEADEKIVVSRRVLQEEKLTEQKAAFWKKTSEGDTFTGVVTSVQEFGVFIDLNGVEGLAHKSEIGWGGEGSSTSIFARGQTVEARVIRLYPDRGRVSLSLKNPDDDPWVRVGTEFLPGATASGTVSRIETFGAFIDLAEGIRGLLHISACRSAGRGLPNLGDRVEVLIRSVDHERRRIDLAYEGDTSEGALSTGGTVSGTIGEVLRNGVLVQMDDGGNGWLPINEVDLPAGTVLAQRFRKGRKITARIRDVDTSSGRLTLTQKTTTEEEASQQWRAHSAQQGKQSFGTLGDLLSGFKKD